MRIDYNVIWVEDQPDRVQAQRISIDNRLRGEGFKLQPEFCKSVEDALQLLGQDIYKDHVDLVLMDYELGTGMQGDEGAKAVRTIIPYRDIVFYSAQSSNDLGARIADLRVEGIFLSSRSDLPETVYNIFDNAIRKMLDIDHARGVALGALSEIESSIERGLVALFDQCNEDQQLAAMDYLRKRLEEQHNELEKDYKALQSMTHIAQAVEHRRLVDAKNRSVLLRKQLAILGIHSEHKQAIISYEENIIPKRNVLAHVGVTKRGFSRTFTLHTGVELTSEAMRDDRIAILQFQELLSLIVPDSEPVDTAQ